MTVQQHGAGSGWKWRMAGLLVAAAVVAVTCSDPLRAQASRTVQEGVYTDAQAARGQALYL